jgi:cytochrome c-type biogenesis protein CcmH/NrfG
MNKPATDNNKLIKLNTALMYAFISLIIGFIAGVVFTNFKNSDLNHSNRAVTTEHARQILDLEKQAAESPENVDAWIALGNAYFDHRQPEKAIGAYQTALKYQPNNAAVWTDLGIMYRQIENPEEAIAAFDKAQEIDPSHEPSLYNKGIVQMHDLKDPESAVATWSKLIELNPSATTQSGMPVKDLIEKLKGSI